MTKHTPGPWIFSEPYFREPTEDNLSIESRRLSAEGPGYSEHVAYVLDASGPDYTLIAAAPELLAELERLAKGFGWGSAHRIGRLVAKAKGE